MTLLRRLQGRCWAMRTVNIGVVVSINADVHGFCVPALGLRRGLTARGRLGGVSDPRARPAQEETGGIVVEGRLPHR